jgi:hypothetical protein
MDEVVGVAVVEGVEEGVVGHVVDLEVDLDGGVVRLERYQVGLLLFKKKMLKNLRILTSGRSRTAVYSRNRGGFGSSGRASVNSRGFGIGNSFRHISIIYK